jgi:chitodextrinase
MAEGLADPTNVQVMQQFALVVLEWLNAAEVPMKFSHRQLGPIGSRFMLLLVGLALLGTRPAASGAREDQPDAPTNLDAIAVSIQEAVLTWSAVSADADITRYSIHRNGAWLATVGIQTPAYVDISVQASTTYTYTVRAIGADDESSRASNVVTIQIPALPENADIAPPSRPESLTATAILGGILLDWYAASDDSDITVYLIRRNGKALTIVRSGVLSYIDPITQLPTTAIYTVEAIDVMGQHSAPSNAASLVPL